MRCLQRQANFSAAEREHSVALRGSGSYKAVASFDILADADADVQDAIKHGNTSDYVVMLATFDGV